jgi:hypothetical protein
VLAKCRKPLWQRLHEPAGGLGSPFLYQRTEAADEVDSQPERRGLVQGLGQNRIGLGFES